MRNLRRFISEDGDKGKITPVLPRPRDHAQDIGMTTAARIRDELGRRGGGGAAMPLEGRQMIMVLAPKRK